MSEFDEREDRAGNGIEALLRTTGRRPAVPSDRTERVAAAVRAHWQSEVERRRRRRTKWFAAATAAAAAVVAAVAIGFWLRSGAPVAGAMAAQVDRMVAPVLSDPDTSLDTGDPIGIGSTLSTADGGRIAIRMRTGHSVRMDGNTRLRIVSEREIALERGAVYVDSRGASDAGSLALRTPFGSLQDVGTQFEARVQAGGLRVRVREGAVLVNRDGSRYEVAAGQELEVAEVGEPTRTAASATGSEWSWIGEVTPMMDLAGSSLREFLDWMARERGLRLTFATPELRASSSQIALRGSIQGMTLDQALESVLSTCRMSHRIHAEVLEITPGF